MKLQWMKKIIKGKKYGDGEDIREGLTIIISVKIPEKYILNL